MMTLLAAALLAQDHPCERVTHCCNEGRDAKPWIALGRGVKWEESFAAAKKRAAKEKKPILLYQLVGPLDKEGC